MICSACGKQSLPGGVRCTYCGVPFPVMPELALEVGSAAPAAALPGTAPAAAKKTAAGGLLSGLLVLLVKGKSLLALLKLGPILTTLLTMAVWIRLEMLYFGWKLAAGLALCILVHELGHVVMNVRHGLKASAPMFIPFFGALITVKEFPADPTVESECGAGGPVAGAAAAGVCALLAGFTAQPYWGTLAFFAFAMNLFNLAPLFFLDGARISTVFSNGNWDFVLLATLLIVIKLPSLPLWGMLLLLFVLRLGRARTGRFQLALPTTRVRMSLVFLGLLLSLCYGVDQFRPTQPIREAASGAYAPRPAAPRAVTRAPARRSAPPALSPRIRRVARIAVTAGTLFLALFCWLLTPFLLFRAAREPVDRRGWRLAGWMVALLLLLLAGGWTFGFWALRGLLFGYVVASLAAFVFAAYRAAHAGIPGGSYASLSWHCLGTTAVAALVIAYWTNSTAILALVLLAAALFYAPRRWLLLSLLARGYDALGRVEPALLLRERALALAPEPEARAILGRAVVSAHLTLARGAAAQAALNQLAQTGDPIGASPFVQGTARATALGYQDRYDAALHECETLLRLPAAGAQAYLHLAAVREILAVLALHRGWPDEALAQCAALLRESASLTGNTVRQITAKMQRVRARALAAEGRLDEAEVALSQALLGERTPTAETSAALTRAEIALKRGEAERAERESAAAMRRLPGSLEVRYRRACVLRASGRNPEADALLRTLAEEFPGEHWGRRAAAALAR